MVRQNVMTTVSMGFADAALERTRRIGRTSGRVSAMARLGREKRRKGGERDEGEVGRFWDEKDVEI